MQERLQKQTCNRKGNLMLAIPYHAGWMTLLSILAVLVRVGCPMFVPVIVAILASTFLVSLSSCFCWLPCLQWNPIVGTYKSR